MHKVGQAVSELQRPGPPFDLPVPLQQRLNVASAPARPNPRPECRQVIKDLYAPAFLKSLANLGQSIARILKGRANIALLAVALAAGLVALAVALVTLVIIQQQGNVLSAAARAEEECAQ